MDLSHGYMYVSVLLSISALVSLYSLVWLFIVLRRELAPFNVGLKMIAVLAVVFFPPLQSVLLATLVHFGVLVNTAGFSVGDIQSGIDNFIVCIEMFIAAAAYKYVFSYEVYANGSMNQLMKARAKRLAECSFRAAVELHQQQIIEQRQQQAAAAASASSTGASFPSASSVFGGGDDELLRRRESDSAHIEMDAFPSSSAELDEAAAAYADESARIMIDEVDDASEGTVLFDENKPMPPALRKSVLRFLSLRFMNKKQQTSASASAATEATATPSTSTTTAATTATQSSTADNFPVIRTALPKH